MEAFRYRVTESPAARAVRSTSATMAGRNSTPGGASSCWTLTNALRTDGDRLHDAMGKNLKRTARALSAQCARQQTGSDERGAGAEQRTA